MAKCIWTVEAPASGSDLAFVSQPRLVCDREGRFGGYCARHIHEGTGCPSETRSPAKRGWLFCDACVARLPAAEREQMRVARELFAKSLSDLRLMPTIPAGENVVVALWNTCWRNAAERIAADRTIEGGLR